jgi:hypothetical protein
MDWRKALISIAILLAIGLHFVPYLRRGPGQRNIFWPFLSWTMYRDSRPAGPIQAKKRRIIGLTRSGQTEEVTARLVGLGPPALSKLYIRPMMAGDSSAVRRLLARLNAGRKDAFVALRIEDETYTVTDSGLMKQQSPVLTYRVEASPTR